MTLKPTQSDASVIKATGKSWEEWRTILDADGMADKDHIWILVHVQSTYGIYSDWWGSAVTTGYERMIGRRQKYQRPDGYFFGSAFKTIHGSYDLVWNVIRMIDPWIEPGIITLRTYSETSLRFDDLDRDKVMQFWLLDKGDRVGVRASAERFLTVEEAIAWKELWEKRLVHLKHVIEENDWHPVR